MKPKHTAEQSTTRVNKSEALGKKGFAGLFQQAKPVEEIIVETETISVQVGEEKVTITEEIAVVTPVQSPKIQSSVTSNQVTSVKKQKAPFTPLSELKSVATAVQSQPKTKVTIHGPEDPMDALLCDGCQ